MLRKFNFNYRVLYWEGKGFIRTGTIDCRGCLSSFQIVDPNLSSLRIQQHGPLTMNKLVAWPLRSNLWLLAWDPSQPRGWTGAPEVAMWIKWCEERRLSPPRAPHPAPDVWHISKSLSFVFHDQMWDSVCKQPRKVCHLFWRSVATVFFSLEWIVHSWEGGEEGGKEKRGMNEGPTVAKSQLDRWIYDTLKNTLWAMNFPFLGDFDSNRMGTLSPLKGKRKPRQKPLEGASERGHLCLPVSLPCFLPYDPSDLLKFLILKWF